MQRADLTYDADVVGRAVGVNGGGADGGDGVVQAELVRVAGAHLRQARDHCKGRRWPHVLTPLYHMVACRWSRADGRVDFV